MARDEFSLDVDHYDQLPDILRAAADRFREDGASLYAAWQDKEPERNWNKVARILDRAADQIEKIG